MNAYKLQDNFMILHGLKILDDVLILCLQEEFPFNECDKKLFKNSCPVLLLSLFFIVFIIEKILSTLAVATGRTSTI
jgi:hypothetical protein